MQQPQEPFLRRSSLLGVLAAAGGVLALLAPGPLQAQDQTAIEQPPATEGEPPAADEASTDANADLLSHIDEALDREIHELSDLARGRGEGPIENAEDLNRTLPEGEGQLGYNAVTSDANPLVSDDCHQQAMRQAVLHLAEQEHLDAHDAVVKGRTHLAEREALIEEGEVTYADYIEHIAECKGFCGPLVKELMGCHVSAVRNLKHDIILFPLDRYDIADEDSQRTIDRTAAVLTDEPTRKILLIGRASRIGKLGYNRRLSGLRANAVRDQLVVDGVAPERVRSLVFGYEPPQIDAEIAAAYGYAQLFARLGTAPVNQSVLMVVY